MQRERSNYWARPKLLFATAARPAIVSGSLRIAALVGTVLNVINQFDALRGTAQLSLSHLGFNYLVPYCVATYGAVRYALGTEARNPDRQ